MQVFSAAASYTSSPLRASHAGLPGFKVSSSNLYGLAGLDDRECIARLIMLLEGKEKEMEKIKREVATKNYDAMWDRARHRNGVPPTPQVERSNGANEIAPKPVANEAGEAADAARAAEPILPQTPASHNTNILGNSILEATVREDQDSIRRAEQKLILSMKAKMRTLEAKLFDAERTAEAAVAAASATTAIRDLFASQQTRITELESEKSASSAKTVALESQITALKAEAQASADAAAKSNAANKTIAVADLSSKVRTLETRLAAANEAATELRAARAKDGNAILTLKATIRDLESSLAHARKQQQVALNTPNNTAHPPTLRARRSVADAENVNPAASVSLSSPRPADQKLLSSLKSKIRTLQARLASAVAESDELRDRIRVLEQLSTPIATTHAQQQLAHPSSYPVATQTDPHVPDATTMEYANKELDFLRASLTALADQVQRAILPGGSQPTSLPSPPPPRQSPEPPNITTPDEQTGPIRTAFQSLHSALTYLESRTVNASDTARAARDDLDKTLANLDQARKDMALARQARDALLNRVRQLEAMVRQKSKQVLSSSKSTYLTDTTLKTTTPGPQPDQPSADTSIQWRKLR
ncbi:hypothetical protein DFJ77DRAFT_507728 [Powellomyces hirtus]|nr:hypothetical protein DFJ77DRAFT_507728 [Powellomyces hirtus]